MGRSPDKLLVAAVALLCLFMVRSARAAPTATVVVRLVPVGVVMDLSGDLGRKRLAAISVALEDFYVKHPIYTTRVGLHVRDTRGDPATAVHAAEDLIKNAHVEAIIAAPQVSAEADVLAQLCGRNRIPVLSFSGVSPTSRLQTVPFFVQTAPNDSFQVAALSSIVLTSFPGRELIVLCEDSSYGTSIIQPLTNALDSNMASAMDTVVVPIGATDDHFEQVLYRLKGMPARLFIVHMRPALAVHLFSRAKDAGMMTKDYIWIASAALGNVVDSLCPGDTEFLEGVVTLRPYVATRFVSNFSAQLKARFHLEDLDVHHMRDPSTLLFWAHDTAWATAMAAERAGLSRSAVWMPETDLSRNGVSATRRALLHSILNLEFDGLAGKFKMVHGELQQPPYEIVNLISRGAMEIGLWRPLSSLPQNLNNEGYSSDNSRSGSGSIEPVFWRELAMTSKGRDTGPLLNPGSKRGSARKLVGRNSGEAYGGNTTKILRIGVPKKDVFKAFVNVSQPYCFCKDNAICPNTTKLVTGYSIEVFEAAMELAHLPSYQFCVFDGSYDELVGNVSSGILDGAAGDVTVTSDRIVKVDFTMPYTPSGVSLLVRSKSDLEPIEWTFLAPLTKELWFATWGFFFFTGFVVWVIERPTNPEYQGSHLRQFTTASYFAFSTLTFSHGHIITSPLSKIVVVVLCFVVLVLMQSYTASFSSILTAERLRPTVTSLDQLLLNGDHVGYQNRSFVYSMLIQQGFSKSMLIPYSKESDYAEGLRKGSTNGGVSAIVDEVPYLTAFLFSDARYQHEFQTVGHVYKTPGLGFVFPLGFPLVHNISAAILNITEGGEGSRMEEKWLGTAAAAPTVPSTPSTPLTVQSFSGLFLISGVISSLMLLISIARQVHARCTGARDADAENIDVAPGDEESVPLQNGTVNISESEQASSVARNGDHHDVQGNGRSGGVDEAGAIQNDMGNSSVHAHGIDETSGCEDLGAVQNGVLDASASASAPARTFQVEKNTG